MDVRSIEQVPPQVVHQGTVENWWLVEPREMKPQSLGGYLELIAVFEIKGGGAAHLHRHHTHEFYYILSGRAVVTIGSEERSVTQGDLVRVPPDVLHSVRPASSNASIRVLAFSMGLKDTADVDYKNDKEK